MKRFFICLCFSLVFCMASLPVYHARFIKYQNGEDRESGELIYSRSEGLYLLVKDPVIQNVHITPGHSAYLFPEESTAIKYRNKNFGFLFPSVEMFINAGKEDLGLSDMGFTLVSHSMRLDTLLMEWEFIGKIKRQNIYMTIKRFSGRPSQVISRNWKGEIIKKVSYSNWMKLNGRLFPLCVSIENDNNIHEYHYSHLTQPDVVPDSLKKLFNIPDSWKTYEYTW